MHYKITCSIKHYGLLNMVSMKVNGMFAATIFDFFNCFGSRLNRCKSYLSVQMTTKQHELKVIDIVTCGQKLMSTKNGSPACRAFFELVLTHMAEFQLKNRKATTLRRLYYWTMKGLTW